MWQWPNIDIFTHIFLCFTIYLYFKFPFSGFAHKPYTWDISLFFFFFFFFFACLYMYRLVLFNTCSEDETTSPRRCRHSLPILPDVVLKEVRVTCVTNPHATFEHLIRSFKKSLYSVLKNGMKRKYVIFEKSTDFAQLMYEKNIATGQDHPPAQSSGGVRRRKFPSPIFFYSFINRISLHFTTTISSPCGTRLRIDTPSLPRARYGLPSGLNQR